MLSKWQLLICFLKDTVTSRCFITGSLCATAAGNEILPKNIVSDLRTLVGNFRGMFPACMRYVETID